MPIAVDDPADPRIEPYRLVRERDLVGRSERFMAEGRVVVEKLADAPGVRLESVLVAAHRAERLAPMFARLPADVPVYAAAQGVMDTVAGFPLHRGLLAIGRRTAAPAADALLAALPTPARLLVLHGIANHDNLGGLFRNAAAFGAGAVLLDRGCCDPLYRKAIRVSVGATLLVPFAWIDVAAELPGLLARHGFDLLTLSPAGAGPLAELAVAPRQAVLLGAEGPGLPPALLARGRGARIPMADGFDSLNVATAGGIVLYHVATHQGRSRERAAPGAL